MGTGHIALRTWDGHGGTLNSWNTPDALIRLVILASLAVVIPTVVRSRVGGSRVSYFGLTAGLVILFIGEAFRLGTAVDPEGSLSRLVNVHLPTYAGGYLLIAVGFLLLMRDMRHTQRTSREAEAAERRRAEAARLQEAKLRAILDGAAEYSIISCDPAGLVTSYSTGGARVLGWEAGEVVGRMNIAAFHATEKSVTPGEVHEAIRSVGHFDGETVMVRKDGRAVPVELTISPLTDAAGGIEGYVGVVKDIAERKAVQDALRRERDFVRGILEINELFIMGLSLEDGRISMFNAGAERISGYGRDEAIGREYAEMLIRPEDRDRIRAGIAAGRAGTVPTVGQREHVIRAKDGSERVIAWTYTASEDEQGRASYVVGFGRDVTAERLMQAQVEKANADLEAANVELQRLATTDYLTGLLNRRQAALLLEREVARCRRQTVPMSVILLDIDHFKAINDTHGHEAGDAALKHVGEVLRGRLRATDVAARHGGEEFLLVLPDTGIDQAAHVAEMVRRQIQEIPVAYGETPIRMAFSLGVTTLEVGQISTPDELVARADEAMYCAKNLGGNRVVLWNRMQEGKVEARLVVSEEVLALQKRVESLTRLNQQAFLERIYNLADTLEAGNAYTARHSRHVAAYADAIARAMHLPADHREMLYRAAMLHDLGRSAVPPEVLWKSDPLTKSDWALVCQHPAASVKVIEHVAFLGREASIIRHHHERPDGRGYPDGLKGDAIPLEARILAAADALDAMTRDRPHRPALPLADALAQLQAGAPHQFDPEVAEGVLAAAREMPNWPLQPQATVAATAN